MTERITQLQDFMMQQADNMWTSVYMVEKCSKPYIFPEMVKKPRKIKKEQVDCAKKKVKVAAEVRTEETDDSTDYPKYYAKRMSELASDINTVINSLPDDSMLTPDIQVESLKVLDETNHRLSEELTGKVLMAEKLLESVKESLNFLSTSYLDIYIKN